MRLLASRRPPFAVLRLSARVFAARAARAAFVAPRTRRACNTPCATSTLEHRP
jgi:hypothetical protein